MQDGGAASMANGTLVTPTETAEMCQCGQPATRTRRTAALLALAPLAAGYFLSYLFRNVNGVIARDIMLDLGVGADVLGLLTSVYFLTFAAAQLPIGVLLDRCGPRPVQTALFLTTAAGAA